MNVPLMALGLIKLGFGILVGGLGVVAAWRLLARVLKLDSVLDNPAAGTVHGAVLLALALLIRNSLSATYDTMDLLLRQGLDQGDALGRVLLHSAAHVGLALVLGSGLLALGVWLFNLMTPGIDELAAVREGKLGPALLLGAIVVTLALLAGPGLEALLSGLVPFPALPAGLGEPSS